MNDLREYLKRELGVSDEEYDAMVQAEAEKSKVNKNIVLLKDESLNTMLALTQVYEEKENQNIQRELENVDTMVALTEAYETILLLENRIAELESKVNGGTV